MATTEMFTSKVRYTDEFKAEAVKQVTERGHSAAQVVRRSGIRKHSLYGWVKRARMAEPVKAEPSSSVREGAASGVPPCVVV